MKDTLEIIYSFYEVEYSGLVMMSIIFIENNRGEVFYIRGNDSDIKNISKMPDYLKQDWLFYNKNEITMDFLDKYISRYLNIKEDWVSFLIQIKRNLSINNIIR